MTASAKLWSASTANAGIQAQLAGKAASSHGHAIADVVDLQATLDAKALASDLAAAQNEIDGRVAYVTGADPTGATVSDAAFTAAASGGFKTIRIPTGNYTVSPGFTLTGINNVHFIGDGSGNTAIRTAGNGSVLRFTSCNFVDISEIAVQHSSGSSGDGILFDGNSSSNYVHDCLISNNPGRGIAFVGTAGTQLSENDAVNNVVLNNLGGGIYFEYSHDYTIANNTIGGVVGGPYPPFGGKLYHADVGLYFGNEHYDNDNAVIVDSCLAPRMHLNRLEESRKEGLLVITTTDLNFSVNQVHTNSKSASGTYSSVKMTDTTGCTFGLNKMFSWDAGTYLTKYGFEEAGTSGNNDYPFNKLANNATADYLIASTSIRIDRSSFPQTTRGDLSVRGASGLQRLALGAAGKALVSDGTDLVYTGRQTGFTVSGACVSTVAAGSTVYLGPNAERSGSNASLYNMPGTLTFAAAYIAVVGAPGVGQTFTYTLRKNGVDTAITGTISGNASFVVTLTGSLSFALYDTLTIKLVTSAGAAAVEHRWTIICDT